MQDPNHQNLRQFFSDTSVDPNDPNASVEHYYITKDGRHLNNFAKFMTASEAEAKNAEYKSIMITSRWIPRSVWDAREGSNPVATETPAPLPAQAPVVDISDGRKLSARNPNPKPSNKQSIAPVEAPAPPSGERVWSHYQNDIFEFSDSGTGDAIVNAKAGSGKTSTLVEVGRRLQVPGIFIAFNKHIAEALNDKLKGTSMGARTVHSIGFETVMRALQGRGRKHDLKDNKYRAIIRELLKYEQDMRKQFPSLQQHLNKLASFCRLTLTDVNSVTAINMMAQHYGLEFDAEYHYLLTQVMQQGDHQAKNGLIDFTDMVWLPYKWKLEPNKFGFVAVDEAQDLNSAQLDLVLKMRAEGGRMLFVGDIRQAIMGFAGADDRSYEAIQKRTGARELPLNICYRCPSSHLTLAQQVVPDIEPRPNAPVGELLEFSEDELGDLVAPGDLVLCRRNAPLIKHALRLIRRKIAARIRGRDVGKELAALVRDIGEHCPDFKKFLEVLGQYKKEQTEYLEQKDATDTMFEILNDKCEAIENCYEGFRVDTAEALARQIENIFADVPDDNCIWLSSIHRSKGLENLRVFILEANRLGMGHPKSRPHELVQEQNLKYVALTRSMQSLILMSEAGVSGLLPFKPEPTDKKEEAA